MAAAEAGHPRAQYNVGWYYKNGKDVPKDLRKAADWWLKSAEQGYPAAQYSLAFDCYDQIGGQDQARKWIQAAADNGHQHAQKYLGFMYLFGGLGLQRDSVLAHKWLILGTRDNLSLPPRIFCKSMKMLMTSKQIAEAERLANSWKPPPNVMSETNPP